MAESAQAYTKRLLSYVGEDDALRVQETTAGRLEGFIGTRSREELARRPSPEKWSVAEVVAHLADAEIAIAWRIRQVLANNKIGIEAYDQDRWAETFAYAQRDPRESLAQFRVLRECNLALLKSVKRELWDNYGVHQERGEESVKHIIRMVAGHDLNHLRQIEAILG